MDADADDDLTTFAVRLDEPAAPPQPHIDPADEPEPPRLTLFSREVAPRDFQPRLLLGGHAG